MKTKRQLLLSTGLAGLMASTGTVASLGPVATEVARTATQVSRPQQTPLTAAEQSRAQAWGLSESEWQRYRDLMQGVRGSISPPTLSPVEVLGIHARNPSERRRFAEQWLRIMHDDAERILAFQHAYDAAAKRLLGDRPLIDVSRLPTASDAVEVLEPGDRLLFFTRPNCPPCDRVWERVRRQVGRIAGIDIYLGGIDGGDDQAVRNWATRHDIDPDWVRRRRVTLNHQGDVLERLSAGTPSEPFLMRYRDGAATRLPPTALD